MGPIDSSLGALQKKYYSLFLAVAYRNVGCKETAKDVIQEAYINVFEKLDDGEYNILDEVQLKQLMLTCIRRRAIDWKRNRSRRRERLLDDSLENLKEEFVVFEEDNSNYVSPLESLKSILDLAKVNPFEKAILEGLLDGKKVSQISKELECTTKKVTNAKFYLLKKLQGIVLKTVGDH